MKKLYTLLLFCIPLVSHAQVDVFNFGTITLGLKTKSITHEGFYGRSQSTNTSGTFYSYDHPEFMKDHGTAINLDAKYFKFEKSNFQSYSLEGLIYFLSYFGNMNAADHGENNYALVKYVTTPSKFLEDVPNSVDFKAESRFWNVDVIAAKASFGKKSLNAGVNIIIKKIGLTGPFTYFLDKNNEYNYHNLTNVGYARLLVGPNIAYRKSFNSFAVVALTGVNFSPNTQDFKIKYNPFVDFDIFFGKAIGGTLGIHYEYMKGVADNKFNDGVKGEHDIKISQLEFKLSIYLSKQAD